MTKYRTTQFFCLARQNTGRCDETGVERDALEQRTKRTGVLPTLERKVVHGCIIHCLLEPKRGRSRRACAYSLRIESPRAPFCTPRGAPARVGASRLAAEAAETAPEQPRARQRTPMLCLRWFTSPCRPPHAPSL
eukprot:2097706-Pleurochrysis_carterae.AAC.1